MGFAKAFDYGNITQLTKEISKPEGMVWLLTAFLFITATVLFPLKNVSWPIFCIVAVIMSQVLIINIWSDAKFGTIANAIILIVAIAGWATQNFKARFRNDVKTN